jgi:hypothetical protein
MKLMIMLMEERWDSNFTQYPTILLSKAYLVPYNPEKCNFWTRVGNFKRGHTHCIFILKSLLMHQIKSTWGSIHRSSWIKIPLLQKAVIFTQARITVGVVALQEIQLCNHSRDLRVCRVDSYKNLSKVLCLGIRYHKLQF